MKLSLFGVAGVLAVSLTACWTETPPPLPNSETIIPVTTKVADQSTKNALTGFDLKTGIMRFSQNTSVLQALKAGDVLSGGRSNNAPDGFLRKVTAIKNANGETVLETTQAMLTDAISKGKIDVSGTLTAANLHSTALRPGVALRTGRFRGGFNQEANLDVVYHPDAPGTGEVHITGLVDFNLGYHIGVDIDFCFIPPVCLNHFDASVGFDQLADLKVTGHLETPIKKDIEIASSDYWTTISILDIEIPVDFKVTLSIGLDGKASVQFSYQGTQSAALKVGEEYNDGRGWSPIAEKNFTLLPGAPQVTGSVEVQATTDFETQVLLIGFVGPGLKASAGLELNGEIPRNPIWTLSGLASLDVTFVVDVPVIGKIVDYSANILKWSSELARSQNTAPTISLQTNQSHLEFGRPFYFASGYPMYAASDLEDGTVNNFKLSSDKDGAIDTNHVFSGVGSRLITVTATDSQGASSSANFTLNVINTPPKVSLTTSSNLPVYVGIPTELSGFATEINPVTGQPNLPVPCNRMYWTSSNATDVVPSSCNGSATFTSSGVRTLTLTAVGQNGALGIAEVLIAVTDPPDNIAPIIDEMHVKDNTGTDVTASQTVATGAPLLLSVKAHDPENDPIHYQWAACLPSWTPLQCSLYGDLPTNADGTATFDFLSRFGNYGTYTLWITADDGHHTFATIGSITITITPKIN